jgi:hypothetical protein
MVFQSGYRRGNVWEEVGGLDTIIENTHFNLTGKSEHEFELALALGDVVVLKATHGMN